MAGEGGVVWKSVWEAGLRGVGTPISGHLIGILACDETLSRVFSRERWNGASG